MCGIVGAVRFDGQRVERDIITQMTAALAHRGPEGKGSQLLTAGPVSIGLGHARLKIIDLSDAAGQPMSNDDGSIWVVFNGEIYNFRDLRADLETKGYCFRTSSDTEVLLRLYEAEGAQCIRALDGMFALAIWDGRRRVLLLARDRVGKKPLFFCSTPKWLVFASEIKALLRHPEVVPRVNTDALPSFFLHGYVPAPSTVYQDIQQLLPGQLLSVGADGRSQIEEYWDLPMAGEPSGRAPSDAEAATRVRELVTAAVRRRLISDVPLGAFLSGGVDSSIIVGIMSQLMRAPVRTFSIGFAGDPRFDETSYARLVSRRFGTAHTEFAVTSSSVELVERLVWHYDGPFADSSAIPTYLLSKLTREHVTVALTGDGGDELFAGYLRFPAALLAERVPGPIRRMVHRVLAGIPEWGGHRSRVRYLQKFAAAAALPLTERYTRWLSVFYEDLPRLLLAVSERRGASPALALVESYLQRYPDASMLSKLLYLNVKMYLLDDLLVKMDRCSMAHALEARSPFLDRELMEYVSALPDAMKLRWGRTKVILRRAFAGLLPPEILTRGKMGFGVPLQKWFAEDLREFLHDLLLAPDACLRQYLNQDYVRKLCQAHMAGRADHSHRLWTLLTFEVWLRQLKSRRGLLMAGQQEDRPVPSYGALR